VKRIAVLISIVAASLLPGNVLAFGQSQQSQPDSSYAQPKSTNTTAPLTDSKSAHQDKTPPTLPGVPETGSTSAAPTSTEPLIGAGDLLKIGVLGASDYDQRVRVGGNGDVTLALVGAVHVGGMTPENAALAIRKRLMEGGYFSDPQVSVFEEEFATQGISILGEVQKPGVYPVIGPRHLFDVISLAGGTTPKAGQMVSITHRSQPGNVQTVNLSNDPQKNVAANVPVLPGDTVVVSRAGIVYVVGAVRRPTGVIMDNGGQLTVLQALAMAEGADTTAAYNKSKIIRKTPQGPKEITVPLKKIMAAKSPDLQLQADDILFVPSSAAKGIASRSVGTAISLASTIVAYRAIY